LDKSTNETVLIDEKVTYSCQDNGRFINDRTKRSVVATCKANNTWEEVEYYPNCTQSE